MRRLALLGLAAIVLTVPAAAGDRVGALAVGGAAPAFTLADQHGEPVRLSDLLATRQFVVLAFYVKAFTPG